jgi:hypothetical protein
MPTALSRAVVALAITTVTGFGADNSIGTWKLNVAKSKYTPGPFPATSVTSKREASDGGVRVTNTGERPGGIQINGSYTAKYDGKEVAVSGEPYDRIAIRQVNANTFTDERRNTGGSYKATGRLVVSKSGKTFTLTMKGTGADGKMFSSTFVMEKQ